MELLCGKESGITEHESQKYNKPEELVSVVNAAFR